MRSSSRVGGVHHQHGRAVDGGVGGHRVQEGDVVDFLAEVREQVADSFAAVAVLPKAPTRFDDAAAITMSTATEHADVARLVVTAVYVGLVVERVFFCDPRLFQSG